MKLDNFYVIGVSHKSLELEEREEFIKNENLEEIAVKNYKLDRIEGYVYLSTCLREELYLHLNGETDILDIVQDLHKNNEIHIYKGMDALRHLFKVVCGLDSVIMGEDQILSQIRKAYSDSVANKKNSKMINFFFHKAVELGKKFRSKSKIAHNPLSLEAISVKFIKEKVGSLKDKKVLVIGVGDLSQGILNIIKKEELGELIVSNRSREKVERIVDKYDIDEVVDFNARYEGIAKSDIIISVTSAPEPIIIREELEKLEIDREKIYLDLAVPRDIDPSIQCRGVYNIDAVWEVYKENLKNRERAGEDHFYLIEKQVEVVLKWFKYRKELGEAC